MAILPAVLLRFSLQARDGMYACRAIDGQISLGGYHIYIPRLAITGGLACPLAVSMKLGLFERLEPDLRKT